MKLELILSYKNIPMVIEENTNTKKEYFGKSTHGI